MNNTFNSVSCRKNSHQISGKFDLNTFNVQVLFNPEGIEFKTVITMDRAARLAMMVDYEM